MTRACREVKWRKRPLAFLPSSKKTMSSVDEFRDALLRILRKIGSLARKARAQPPWSSGGMPRRCGLLAGATKASPSGAIASRNFSDRDELQLV